MAFDASNLSALTYANGCTMWHYRTLDDFRVMDDDDEYFNPAVPLLKPGDFIFVNANVGERVPTSVIYVVGERTDTTVHVYAY